MYPFSCDSRWCEAVTKENIMKANVGSVDRVLRVILGLALLSMLGWAPEPWKYVGLIGLVPLGTALVSFCPVYALFGMSTCPMKRV